MVLYNLTHSMPAREARASSVSANDRPTAFVKYMKSQMLIVAAALACAAGAAAFAGGPSVQQTSTMPDRAAITKMRSRFAPVDIKADVARLTPGDRRALAKLVEAARIMDALFLRQVWAGNPALLQQLSRRRWPQAPTAPPPRSCTTS